MDNMHSTSMVLNQQLSASSTGLHKNNESTENEKSLYAVIDDKQIQTCSDKIENKNLEDSIDLTLIFENMNYHRSPLYTIFE